MSCKDKYKDLYSKDSILTMLEKCKDRDEVRSLIDNTFPGWLRWYGDRYSNDYPHLTANWKTICQKIGVDTQYIILVDQIPLFEKDTELLQHFCEKMTQMGYVVRRKEEFIFCKKCEAAIPSEKVYDMMKKMMGNKIPLPKAWKDHCSTC